MPSVHLSVAGRTDVGRARKNNEDSFVVADLTRGNLLQGDAQVARFDVGERGVLLAVSDGMGGEAAGEVASALVVQSLTGAMAAPSNAPSDALLKDAVQKAHRDVWEAAHHSGREGMGATLTAVFVQGQPSNTTAYIAEVGDSRAYLVRAGAITRLTKDQSYVQVLLDAGVIGPQDAEHSPVRNVILQAMGHDHAIAVALGKLELRNRDCLILCSDGLTNAVPDEEIREILLASPSLDAACSRLVDLANERGGEDNVTVVVVGVGGDLAPSSSTENVNETFKILESFEPSTSPLAGKPVTAPASRAV
jgi:PPM family protein phosphatase